MTVLDDAKRALQACEDGIALLTAQQKSNQLLVNDYNKRTLEVENKRKTYNVAKAEYDNKLANWTAKTGDYNNFKKYNGKNNQFWANETDGTCWWGENWNGAHEWCHNKANEKGYDAEATVSPKGDKIVFTSTRSGDLELYTMNIDGSEVTQITDELGYDGGAFFSPDGTQLIFRSSRPKTPEAIAKYKDLLAQGLVEPTEMELYICDADGGNLRQLTRLGNANWSPFFHPSGKKILFSSNFEAERGFPFNLYLIDIDGKNLERVTHSETFDAFPVFSNDGKYLAFSSNRNNGGGRDTNLFIAEWKD